MAGEPLRDEVVELAQELIRIDTSNPPGNETRAAKLIAAHLRESGVECELVGPDPERLNLVARIAGAGSGPSIMLLAHTDVVPAPTEGWTVPPFAATLADGRLIGRGAVDMKNELAARVVAVAALARSGVRPAGDVVLIAEADEERNVSDVGLSWLARERPDLRCDFAINEGGGVLLELASGRRMLTVSVGEKQATSLRVRVLGRAGHASIPPRGDNALRHAATAVDRLLDHTEPPTLVRSVAAALETLGAPAGAPEEMIAWAASQHPVLADDLRAVTRLTVTPTGLHTHEPPNVVPPFVDVICDCRTLPGQGVDDIRDYVGRVLRDDFSYELELLEPLAGGTESPTDTPLFEALRDYAASRAHADLLPLLSAGFTDSHWIREAWGTVAYGFAPVLFGDLDAYLNAAHGADEAIEITDLLEMAEFHLQLLTSPALASARPA